MPIKFSLYVWVLLIMCTLCLLITLLRPDQCLILLHWAAVHQTRPHWMHWMRPTFAFVLHCPPALEEVTACTLAVNELGNEHWFEPHHQFIQFFFTPAPLPQHILVNHFTLRTIKLVIVTLPSSQLTGLITSVAPIALNPLKILFSRQLRSTISWIFPPCILEIITPGVWLLNLMLEQSLTYWH